MNKVDAKNIQVYVYEGVNSQPRFTFTNRWKVKGPSTIEIVNAAGDMIGVECLPDGGFKIVSIDAKANIQALNEDVDGSYYTV